VAGPLLLRVSTQPAWRVRHCQRLASYSAGSAPCTISAASSALGATDTRTRARAALLPAELLERPLTDAGSTAAAFGVPIRELLHARDSVDSSGRRADEPFESREATRGYVDALFAPVASGLVIEFRLPPKQGRARCPRTARLAAPAPRCTCGHGCRTVGRCAWVSVGTRPRWLQQTPDAGRALCGYEVASLERGDAGYGGERTKSGECADGGPVEAGGGHWA